MNKNDFNRFIGAGVVPESADLEGVRELTVLFPWFHSAHLVLLRGLRENSDIKFGSQLKGSALYVADRSILYNYLFLNFPESTDVVPAAVPSAVSAAAQEPVSEVVQDAVSADTAEPVSEITLSPESVDVPEPVSEIAPDAGLSDLTEPVSEVVPDVVPAEAQESESVDAPVAVPIDAMEPVTDIPEPEAVIEAPEPQLVEIPEQEPEIEIPEPQLVEIPEQEPEIEIPEPQAVEISQPEAAIDTPESLPDELTEKHEPEIETAGLESTPDTGETVPVQEEITGVTEEVYDNLPGEQGSVIEIPEPVIDTEVPESEPVVAVADKEIISGISEEIAGIGVPVPEPEDSITEENYTEDTSLKTRDQLIAEIEARLVELEKEDLLELAEGHEITVDSAPADAPGLQTITEEKTGDSGQEETPPELKIPEEINSGSVSGESNTVIAGESSGDEPEVMSGEEPEVMSGEEPVVTADEKHEVISAESENPETVTGEVYVTEPDESKGAADDSAEDATDDSADDAANDSADDAANDSVEDAAENEPVVETAATEPAKQLSASDLIDRFIQTSPRIERMVPGEVLPLQDLTEKRTEEPTPFITETLARIYVTQGYYTRAINIYEKLTLQFPEKSAYFASRIEKIKELIK